MIKEITKRDEGKSTLLSDAQRVSGWCKETGWRRGTWFRNGMFEVSAQGITGPPVTAV